MNVHNHAYYNLHGMLGSGEHLSSPSNSTDVGWRTLTSTQPVATLSSFDPTVGQVGGSFFYLTLCFCNYNYICKIARNWSKCFVVVSELRLP